MTNVYVRIAVYILSNLIGLIPASAVGWFTWAYVDGVVAMTLNVEGAITAAVTAIGISAGVFRLWGTK